MRICTKKVINIVHFPNVPLNSNISLNGVKSLKWRPWDSVRGGEGSSERGRPTSCVQLCRVVYCQRKTASVRFINRVGCLEGGESTTDNERPSTSPNFLLSNISVPGVTSVKPRSSFNVTVILKSRFHFAPKKQLECEFGSFAALTREMPFKCSCIPDIN